MAALQTSPNCKGTPTTNPPTSPPSDPLANNLAGSTAPAATASRPALNEAQHILEMARELKKLAAKSGLARVALILEMAELEARDQVLGRA